MENNHYMYVLRCKDNTYYTGYTNALEKRIAKHNEGKGAKYTRGRRPVELIYQKTFSTKEEAMKAEYMFKRLSRIHKEKIMRGEIPFQCGDNIASQKNS